MKSCFGYVRVSTLRQGEGVSLEAQKDAIVGYATKNHIEISQWFEEKETAAKAGRPVFLNMLRLLRSHKADGVVLHKPDRAARNFTDWAKIGDLADSGIDVHFASESLDFRSRGGRLSADIQAVIAADYIRNLKEEIHKGQNGQLQRGIYPFKAPLGYLNNGGGKLKPIDPIKGPLVKRVFELYASGQYSLRSLLVEIERMGLQSRRGTKVSKGSLETILRNTFYAGVIKIQRSGEVFQGNHEPLISPELFERAQQVRLGKYSKRITRHAHTFRGLFTCANCTMSMVGEMQKGHIYYRCHTPTCATKTVREEQLEEAILGILASLKITDDATARLTKLLSESIATHTATSPTKSYRLQLEQLNQRLERMTDALIDRLIDAETFNSKKEALLLEKRQVEEKAQNDLENRAAPSDIKNFFEQVKNLVQYYKIGTKDEKRQIIKTTTSNRRVSLKSVIVEPSKWVQAFGNTVGVLLGGDDPTTSRSSHGVTKEQVEILLNCTHQDLISKLEAIARPDSSIRKSLRSSRSPKGHFPRFHEGQ